MANRYDDEEECERHRNWLADNDYIIIVDCERVETEEDSAQLYSASVIEYETLVALSTGVDLLGLDLRNGKPVDTAA
jgi:hypothetical protein